MQKEEKSRTYVRPPDISVLAVLMGILAIFLIVMGGVVLATLFISQQLIALLTGLIPLLLGFLALSLVWGLWNVRRWSFWMSIIVAILSLLVTTLTFDENFMGNFVAVGTSALSVVILIYIVSSREVWRILLAR